MIVEKRKNKNGTTTFSVRYIDEQTGKNIRLPLNKYPKFESLDEAKDWCKSQQAIYASRKAAHEAKLSWKTKFYDFNGLSDLFKKYQKKKAPNSWESTIGYLENWVFPFYLQLKKSGNVNDWYLSFAEFRDWISSEDRTPRKGKSQGLARHTQNHVIKALNCFLTCLGEYGKIDEASVRKCKALPHDPEADITLSDIIMPDERELIYRTILSNTENKAAKAAAEFFYVMWHTGMRFSELFGLTIAGQSEHVATLHKGTLKNDLLDAKWKRAEIAYTAWLYLDSQPANDTCKRDGKTLKRKPLKWCPSISPKYARSIPIESELVYKIMANRYLDAVQRFDAHLFTGLKSDYRYFEDLTWGQATSSIRDAYIALGMEPKSFHKCRHSFATFFKSRVGSEVTMQVTGHRKLETLAKYDHINELISMQSHGDVGDEIQRVD